MSLKPVKSLGQRYQAKIFKHYVDIENIVVPSEVKHTAAITYKRPYLIFCSTASVYDIYGGYDYYSNVVLTDDLLKVVKTYVGTSNYIKIEKDKKYAFINPYNNKMYFVGLFTKTRPGWDANEFNVVETEAVNLSDVDMFNTAVQKRVIGDNISKFSREKRMYYALQTFNYIPIDDISDTTSEHVRGNIMREETRSIRWDYDNIPLEENDIVQLENGKYYIVQDIITKQRVGFNTYKTYAAMLYKVGV